MFLNFLYLLTGFPGGSEVKNPLPKQEMQVWSMWLERSPRERNGNPIQHSCLGKPMDRGVWQATVCGVAEELDTTQWLNNISSCSDMAEPLGPSLWDFPGGSDGKSICLQWGRTQVQSLGKEDPLEKAMATHSSTLAWKILWMEATVYGSQRVGHDWVTLLSLFLFRTQGKAGHPRTTCLIPKDNK